MSPRWLNWIAATLAPAVSSCATHGETTPRRSRELAVTPSLAPLQLPEPPAGAPKPALSASLESATVPRFFECPEVLVAARKGGSAPDRYVIPTLAEQAEMSKLFTRLVVDDPPGLVDAARTLGFELAPLPGQTVVWSLVELAERKRGGGAYLVRAATQSQLVVQAPHTFFDEGTLPLSCELFWRSGARALFIETAHRYKAAEAGAAGNFPADLAHSEDSLFQAATRGLLSQGARTTLVQLHGFGPRESGSDVVLSSGAPAISPLVDSAWQALGQVVGQVQRFPLDTRELGATTNVQGALARGQGARFLHVELSATLRARLLQESDLRARFFEALIRGLSEK